MTMAITLKPGDSGDLVKRLQTALMGLGYDLGLAGADGTFGDRTRSAIAGFQDSRGLASTGVADPATIAAMDLDPDTLADLIELDPEPSSGTGQPSAPVVAVVAGDDVYLDPPMRLWPQYDDRWKHQ